MNMALNYFRFFFFKKRNKIQNIRRTVRSQIWIRLWIILSKLCNIWKLYDKRAFAFREENVIRQ
jgi:hypothetical protein